MQEYISTLPAEAGAYCLILRLEQATFVAVGKLGEFDFQAGWYVYAGSAHGPGGLRGRLQHHLRPVVKPHWHIDYLRPHARLRAIWYRTGAAVGEEHDWAAVLSDLPGAAIPAKRFGASDCRCPSHLYQFPQRPAVGAFQAAGGPVQRLMLD